MEIVDAAGGSYEEGDPKTFAGRVWLGQGLATADGTGMRVVHFAAGARTHWHAHRDGQLLYVVSGRGLVRSRGGPGRALVAGDLVMVPAGEWHFHGGGPDSPMAHVSVNVGGAVTWGDPVSDREYAEGV